MKELDIPSVFQLSVWLLPPEHTAPPFQVGFCELALTGRAGEYQLSQDASARAALLRDAGKARQLDSSLGSGRGRIALVEEIAPDGSALLRVHFFSAGIVDFGEIEIGVNEKMLVSARRAFGSKNTPLPVLLPLLEYACTFQTGDGPEAHWFFFSAGPAAEKDFAADGAAPGSEPEVEPGVAPAAIPAEPTPRKGAFCLHGDRFRIPVAASADPANGEFALATKLIPARGAAADRAVRLARGRLRFSDGTRTGRLRARAAATMAQLLQSPDSYLKKWDEYGEQEGNLLLELAREIGVLDWNNHESLGEKVKVHLKHPRPEALREGQDLEFVERLPVYLERPDMTWAAYAALLEAEAGAKGAGAQTSPAKAERGRVVEAQDRSVTLLLDVPPSNPALLLVYSLGGSRTSIQRQMHARRVIAEGRAANPLLGLLIEEGAPLPPRERRPEVPALSSFVQTKVFAHGATPRQTEAVRVALNTPDIALIQGPPGTGKSTVITAIIERLNELSDKSVPIRGEILVSGFQHDAVENLTARMQLNSLPVPKFGRRQGGPDTAALADERLRRWSEDLARQLRERNPTLKVSEQQRRLGVLCQEYVVSPSLRQAIHLLDAVLALPHASLPPGLAETALALHDDLRESLRGQEAHDPGLLRAVRALPTGVEAFADGGPDRAADVLARGEALLSDAETSLLAQAAGWWGGELPPFIDALRPLKQQLLARCAPRTAFRAEKPRADVLEFLERVQDSLRDRVHDRRNAVDAVLADFLDGLDNDRRAVLEAVKDYSYVYAATLQGSEGTEMAKERRRLERGPEDWSFGTVIVDEAARSGPRDLLIPLAQARDRIILVGDHRQLPHVVDEKVLRVLEATGGAGASPADGRTGQEMEDEYLRESMFLLPDKAASAPREGGWCPAHRHPRPAIPHAPGARRFRQRAILRGVRRGFRVGTNGGGLSSRSARHRREAGAVDQRAGGARAHRARGHKLRPPGGSGGGGRNAGGVDALAGGCRSELRGD